MARAPDEPSQPLDDGGDESDESEPLLEDVPSGRRCCGLRPRYLLGLSMILVVVTIWVAAGAFVQYIYDDVKFRAPFFLTYIATSLFAVYLPVVGIHSMWRRSRKPATAASAAGTHAASPAKRQPLTVRQTAMASLVVCPLWFLANWLYNASLMYTSLSINSILSTSSSLFTYILSVMVLGERVTAVRLFGVLLSMAGSTLVSIAHGDAGTDHNTIYGDLLTLLAGLGYAVYSTVICVMLPDDNLVSMPLFFGFLGLFNFLLLGGVVIVLHFTGLESLTTLTWNTLGLLAVKGLFDNVLSDYLWARSMLLTSPVVATVGLALTVPLAIIVDFLLHGSIPIPLRMAGAVLVMTGFVSVNIAHDLQPPACCRGTCFETMWIRCVYPRTRDTQEARVNP